MTEPIGVRAYDEESQQIVELPRPLEVDVVVDGEHRTLRLRMARGTLTTRTTMHSVDKSIHPQYIEGAEVSHEPSHGEPPCPKPPRSHAYSRDAPS